MERENREIKKRLNLFSEILIKPKPIIKPPPIPDKPCLTSAKVNKLAGVAGNANKKIIYELPIIKTSNNFALGKLRYLINGDSILESQ